MSETRVHTIADIARIAGVSKSTVSRALNDSPLIGAETKERIVAIARDHEFQMNVPARRLSLQRSHTVALVTYARKGIADVQDVFMLEIMSGISSALHAHDYDLLVIQVDPRETAWVRGYLETGRVDGFVLLSAACTPQHIRTLIVTQAPFILWGLAPERFEFSSVTGDSVAGGRIATEHLLAVGRRRLAFLGGPRELPEVEDRYRGYTSALEAAGQEVDPARVGYGHWTEDSGAAAMEELLERAPDLDGVFVNSDLMAIAAMDVIREAGRRIPDDVAVVGYDDVSIARYSNPPLTTIRQDGPLAGRLLAENLLEHIRTGVVTNVSIPAELVVRSST